VAAGFITPLAALSFGLIGTAARSGIATTFVPIAWLAAGIALHFSARPLLGTLRE
jgi:hypothetical protein